MTAGVAERRLRSRAAPGSPRGAPSSRAFRNSPEKP
jgi:hypothetical protein